MAPHSVIAELAAKRVLGKGPDGYREALEFIVRARWGDDVNPRIERLRESLEEPLLVTNRVNIHYLFGFKSSNAALLVEPDRARLFTDFRYSEAARAVEGVEFEETKRALLKDLAERLSGPVGFEARLRLVLRLRDAPRRIDRADPAAGTRRAAARGQGRGGARCDRAGREITDRCSSGWSRSASSAAPSATLRGPSDSSSVRRAPTPSPSRRSSRQGRTRHVRTAAPTDRRSDVARPS